MEQTEGRKWARKLESKIEWKEKRGGENAGEASAEFKVRND